MIKEFIKVHLLDPFNQDRYPPIKEKETIPLYSLENDIIFRFIADIERLKHE